jgi:hypothetical protein
MASASALLAAVGKLARPGPRPWADGPVCSRAEIKAWEIELEDFLYLVATVERSAPSTAVAAQWLRRLFYSTPLGRAGPRFDQLLATNSARLGAPVTTVDLRQSTLDALVRIGWIHIPSASAPFDRVEVSHLLPALDLRFNGLSRAGWTFFNTIPDLNEAESIVSWTGDLGSAWLGYQKAYLNAKAAAGSSWSEPITPAALATPLGWLDDGIRDRAPLDDLLGDMDAIVLAHQPIPTSPTPLATLLGDYYAPGHSTGTAVRVADRFALFVTRAVPAIPHTVSATGVTLDPGARDQIRKILDDAAESLLAAARRTIFSLRGELDSPWGSRMIDELADRFTAFLTDGLAGRTPTWLAGPPPVEIPYPGYDLVPLATPAPVPPPPGIGELEALAQFHLNWQQPHRPLPATRSTFRPLDLHDSAGSRAQVATGAPTPPAGQTRITVEDVVDLRSVIGAAAPSEHRDLLRLDTDTARPSKTYRIVAVDPSTRTLTIEGAPVITGSSAWRVLRRPRLVLVDPFGGRVGGTAATPLAPPASSDRITLDGTPDLDRVLANFDTIRLEEDTGRPSRTYRIVGVASSGAEVTLDAAPTLAVPSRWQVPAGAAPVITPPAHTFSAISTGCDHYDGLLFVIYDDATQGDPLLFTSYTSVRQTGTNLSSISGNGWYSATAHRSDNDYRNYAFRLLDPADDPQLTDVIDDAAFFFENATALRTPVTVRDPPVARDANGKQRVRIHYGNQAGNGTGSAGCVVSPLYFELRARLIARHQAERTLLGLAADADLDAIADARTLQESKDLYNAGAVGDAEWTGRLAAHLVLVRPDRRRRHGDP